MPACLPACHAPHTAQPSYMPVFSPESFAGRVELQLPPTDDRDCTSASILAHLVAKRVICSFFCGPPKAGKVALREEEEDEEDPRLLPQSSDRKGSFTSVAPCPRKDLRRGGADEARKERAGRPPWIRRLRGGNGHSPVLDPWRRRRRRQRQRPERSIRKERRAPAP